MHELPPKLQDCPAMADDGKDQDTEVVPQDRGVDRQM